jgi:hypothetical protein
VVLPPLMVTVLHFHENFQVEQEFFHYYQ